MNHVMDTMFTENRLGVKLTYLYIWCRNYFKTKLMVSSVRKFVASKTIIWEMQKPEFNHSRYFCQRILGTSLPECALMIHLMNFLSNKMKSLTPNKPQGKSIEKRRQIGINTKTMNKSKAIHWRATRQSHQNGVSRKRKLEFKSTRRAKSVKR